MAKCKYCGAEVDDYASFCPNCGKIGPVDDDTMADTYIPVSSSYSTTSKSTATTNKTSSVSSGYSTTKREMIVRGKLSGIALAGFCVSFFFPFIGLPFSITAYSRAKYDSYITNKRYAIAGIVISIIVLVAALIALIVILANR